MKLIENRYTSEGYEQKKNEINAMSQEKLVTEILKERARELAFEGHRWFDLRRWGIATNSTHMVPGCAINARLHAQRT